MSQVGGSYSLRLAKLAQLDLGMLASSADASVAADERKELRELLSYWHTVDTCRCSAAGDNST